LPKGFLFKTPKLSDVCDKSHIKLINDMKKEIKIEIFPDKKGGEWGDYENNLIWTDGDTMRKMEDIIQSLFWKDSDGVQHRDRLWVKLNNSNNYEQ